MSNLNYKVGDIVNILYNNTKAVVLGLEENKLFDSVYCVKVCLLYTSDAADD